MRAGAVWRLLTATIASGRGMTGPDETASRAGRDALGLVCFVIHLAVLVTVLAGWAAPWRGALMAYLVFLPALYVQWQFNKDSCILNNIETWLRTGAWRNRAVNPEEGAWLLTLITDVTGWAVTERQINLLSYSVLALLWLVALLRLVL